MLAIFTILLGALLPAIPQLLPLIHNTALQTGLVVGMGGLANLYHLYQTSPADAVKKNA